MKRRLFTFAMLAAAAYGVTIPRPAGEVAIQTSPAGQQLLSQYRGKIVVLGFILTT
jgi:hypothetical protein